MSIKRLLATIRKAFEHKYFPVAIALLAFLISLPAVKCDLLVDDLIQRAVLIDADRVPQQYRDIGLAPTGSGKLSTAMRDQFDFSFDHEVFRRGRDYGILPWWTRAQFKASLWRPISSFTHWLDYRLFPDSPPAMHVHSLIWFSAAALLIATFYRRLIGPTWIAALAGLLYVIDENNFMPVMFIANRNALIALFFGMLCILAHHRWRRNGSRMAAVAAPALFLLSMFSAEAGLATFAYLLAYAVALERGPLAKRALSLVPAVCMIVLWRIIYSTLGYGTHDVGLYIDPVNEPVRYALALVDRVPLMLAGLLSPMSPDLASSFNPAAARWYLIFSLVILAFAFAALTPFLRSSRLARFFLLAAVCAVLPFCATFVSGRNLLFASVAGFALIAMFVGQVVTGATWMPRSRLWRIPVWVLCLMLLLVHVPQALAGRVVAPEMTVRMMSAVTTAQLEGSARPDRDVVVVNSTSPLGMIYVPYAQLRRGQSPPRTLRTLVPALRPIEVHRPGSNTLLITSKGGDLFSCAECGPMHIAYVLGLFHELLLRGNRSFQVGEAVILSGLKIEIAAVDERSVPTQISFTFATALDDESLKWYYFDWHSFAYAPFEIPAIGHTVDLPGPGPIEPTIIIKFLTGKLETKD